MPPSSCRAVGPPHPVIPLVSPGDLAEGLSPPEKQFLAYPMLLGRSLWQRCQGLSVLVIGSLLW